MRTALRLAAIWLAALTPTVLALAFWSILEPASGWEQITLLAILLATLGPVQLAAVIAALLATGRKP